MFVYLNSDAIYWQNYEDHYVQYKEEYELIAEYIHPKPKNLEKANIMNYYLKHGFGIRLWEKETSHSTAKII